MSIDIKKIDNYNEEIINTKYFNLDDAIKSNILSRTAFIIANERMTSKNAIGRYFTVFPSFTCFLERRHLYPHCHELFVDHKKSKANKGGRLVFDFDIKDIIVPENFKEMIESTIEKVIDKHFNKVDKSKFIYVWSTSLNKIKFSKHLTVKNLYFDDWIQMSKIFYKLFYNEWKDCGYDWINPDKLVDFQIIRNRASLRMAYSSKIGGNPLVLDNPLHHFVDSLIRIYFKNHRDSEQTIKFTNLSDNIIEEEKQFEIEQEYYATKFFVSSKSFKEKSAPTFDKKYYDNAFKLLTEIMSKSEKKPVFRPSEINGSIIRILRLRPARCLLSNACHEAENAFLLITFDGFQHAVRYGCFRYCSKIKTKKIGYVTEDSYTIGDDVKHHDSIVFISDSETDSDSDSVDPHKHITNIIDIDIDLGVDTDTDIETEPLYFEYKKKIFTKSDRKIRDKIIKEFNIENKSSKKISKRKNLNREKKRQKTLDKINDIDIDDNIIFDIDLSN